MTSSPAIETAAAIRLHLAAAMDSLHRARILAERYGAETSDQRATIAVYGAVMETSEARRVLAGVGR